MSKQSNEKNLDLSSLRNRISSKLNDQKTKNKKKTDTTGKTTKVATKKVETSNDDTKTDTNNNDILRREAIALGASENDIELVKDLKDEDDEASEQEFDDDDSKPTDPKFNEDLKNFVKSIGLNDKMVQDIQDDENEESLSSESQSEQEQEQEQKEDSKVSDDEEEKEDLDENEVESDKLDIETDKAKRDSGFISQTQILNTDKLIIPNDASWYDIPLDSRIEQNARETNQPISNDLIEKLYQRGKEALETDNQTYYDEFTKESSQRKFMSQMLSDGTLNDKISALTLLVQDSPLHNTKSLDILLSYCNKKSRNSQLQSVNAIKDLFVNGLLPDRKLRYFKNQPGLSMMINKRTLALFYFEDYLKKLFFKLLEVLEKLSHDPIIHVRSQSLTHVFDLLTSKPEQEFNLLKLGVNKLGDIDSKVSSKTSYLLLRLEQAHPNMKSIIIDAIVDISLRPNADYHTTYYSVITLNQTIMKRSEDEVANKLIKTYFTLFSKFLINSDKDQVDDIEIKSEAKGYEKKRKKNFKRGKNGGKSVKNEKTDGEVLNEKNSKLFSALLTGINRAFPFAQLPASVYETHLETLFRITHSANFNTSVQALVLINQVTVKANLNSDRYYRTLYESLLDQRLLNSSKQGIFLNLLYKSLKQDSDNIARVEAFVKRILQVASHWLNIGTTTGFLFLLLQLSKTLPQIRNLLSNSPMDDEYQSEDEDATESKDDKVKKVYDSRKRDPRFANADKSSLWEITHFLNHFHPTVQAYAASFVENSTQDMVKPDLGLFTLTHFLDRFVYRNAKQKPIGRGSSIMQPLFGGSKINRTLLVRASDVVLNETPVNTEDWLNKKMSQINPEDKFFYQYFSSKKSAIKKQKATKSHEFDSEDEMDENDIWNALVKSRPDVEDDSEDEIGFNDEDLSGMSDSDEDIQLDDDSEDNIEENEVDIPSDLEDNGSDEDIFYSFADENESSNKRTLGDSGEENEIEESEKPKKKKSRKQKMKELPLFASTDDYAKYLGSDSE